MSKGKKAGIIIACTIVIIVAIVLVIVKPWEPIYTLSVSVSPTEAGFISPPGGEYESGVQVTLIASPASNYTFDYWSGNASGTTSNVTIAMDSDKSLNAHFRAQEVSEWHIVGRWLTMPEAKSGIPGIENISSGIAVAEDEAGNKAYYSNYELNGQKLVNVTVWKKVSTDTHVLVLRAIVNPQSGAILWARKPAEEGPVYYFIENGDNAPMVKFLFDRSQNVVLDLDSGRPILFNDSDGMLEYYCILKNNGPQLLLENRIQQEIDADEITGLSQILQESGIINEDGMARSDGLIIGLKYFNDVYIGTEIMYRDSQAVVQLSVSLTGQVSSVCQYDFEGNQLG